MHATDDDAAKEVHKALCTGGVWGLPPPSPGRQSRFRHTITASQNSGLGCTSQWVLLRSLFCCSVNKLCRGRRQLQAGSLLLMKLM